MIAEDGHDREEDMSGDSGKGLGALSGSREPSPSSTGLGPSGFDPARLAGLLRALAHDCENTDGWEGAAEDVHAAADCLLILNLRMTDALDWCDSVMNDPPEYDDDDWHRGYFSAARRARSYLAREAIATETRRAETTEIGSVEDEGAGPKDIAQNPAKGSSQ